MSARHVALFALVALAACSGGGEAVPRDRVATTITSPASTASNRDSGVTTPTADKPVATSVPSIVTTTPSSLPDESTEAALAARVRGFLAARALANAGPTPNPEDPNLAAWATGAALAELRTEAAQRRDSGQAVRPAEPSQATARVGFVEQTGTAATVSVCRIDDGVVYEVASGRVVNDTVGTQHLQLDLVMADGAWKVSTITRLQRWEGVAGCALAEADFPY